jgi:hypothetical protein
MAISALINRQVFTTRVFDSGALTVLASVIHQFAEPGLYYVTIRRGDAVLGTTRFEVVAEAGPTQLNLDLSVAGSPAGARSPFLRSTRGAAAKDCDCGGHGASAGREVAAAAATPTVSAKGYVQFFVSQGDGGLSASVARADGDKVLFDTTTLGASDLFAVSLIAPATFSMANKLGKATGKITVTFSKEVARRLKTTAPVYVEASKSAFAPNDIPLSSGQGIVFRVTETARIVVTQETEPAQATPGGRPGRRTFRRLRPLSQRKT